jgi:DtxR family Mn-dependent transcriptional regulator
MSRASALSESLGDYLECIYHLARSEPAARVRDIAERMNVQMSSVTGALRSLAERRLINYEPYGLITLTPRGQKAARELVRRHDALTQFLMRVLSVDSAAASRNACHMEHAIEPQVLEKLVRFVQFIENCPGAGNCWEHGFKEVCGRGEDAEECRRCIGAELAEVAGKI